ncbi:MULTISPECIES: hypothetical protein [Arthrobacter]|uniref:Uncharacterized protein n=1 Tax=Arthrobacter terricola TaxID=2547396 RepID=A0A4R5K6N7_9MICC|nr:MULTISPECIES: hypothetical protein [Arthrobacter]MBT8163446.1 hypothetical protein [Arthrobacter sp. GN70]TDF89777.1 hypothetical protein E1809_22810 [Arthrobacter terricola]
MELFWPESFDRQLGRLEDEADHSDEGARAVFENVVAEMDYLRRLTSPPTSETPTLKTIRQAKKYEVWRVSHPYHQGIAVRLICWFPPDENTAVVALFSGASQHGRRFYDSVGTRAGQIIEQWIREGEGEENGQEDF